jgi:two-component system, NarL family, response regulator LiaR
MEAGPDLSSLNANTRHWGAVTDPVSLLIADHAPARLGIKMALGPEVTVCAEADEIEQAIRAAERQRPRVVLLGRGLCADVTVAVRAICLGAPDSAVVVLAPRGDVDDMLDAVRAGAVGYVPGALGADRLRRVLWSIIADEAVLPRAMVTDLLSELRGRKTTGSLTERETQVLGMLRHGHATAVIAARLQITPVTVRRHVSELVHKLGVDGRADLVGRVDG